jgi:hypothetical protein
MDSKTYKLANSPNDSLANVKDPMLGWIIAYMFVVGFLGLFAVVPLRKVNAQRDLASIATIPIARADALRIVSRWAFFSFSVS